jgi:hypothetical protein
MPGYRSPLGIITGCQRISSVPDPLENLAQRILGFGEVGTLEQEMNGIEYTPQKGDSPFAPQTGSQADFTYSMSSDVIAIVDLGLGNRVRDQ